MNFNFERTVKENNMAIIRRNTDGSIASREGFADPNQTTTSPPSISS